MAVYRVEELWTSPEHPIPHRVACAQVAPEPQAFCGSQGHRTSLDLEYGWTELTSLSQRRKCVHMYVCVCVYVHAYTVAPATRRKEGASSETNMLHVLYQICR